MPGQMFDHIREMYQAELYEDLKQLVSVESNVVLFRVSECSAYIYNRL